MKADIIDEYSHLISPLHRWELRCKLVGFLLLIFAFSSTAVSSGFSDLQASFNPIEKHPSASAPFDAVWKKSRLLMLCGGLAFFLFIVFPYSTLSFPKGRADLAILASLQLII